MKRTVFFILLLFNVLNITKAQETFNYEESKVGNYQLPALLKFNDGKPVSGAKDWQRRRDEIIRLYQKNVYGIVPPAPPGMHYEVLKSNTQALSGTAISKQVRIYFTAKNEAPYMDLLLYLPANHPQPVPVFFGLNFRGNQCVHTDSSILKSEKLPLVLQHIKYDSSDQIRGKQASRWQLELLIKNGFGVATAFSGDLEPDFAQGWKAGIRTSLKNSLGVQPEEWGAISAWAWGLSRIVDYLLTEPGVDANQLIVTGHSRLGKAALWAGANDQRMAAVISNNSGEGGAALARRWFGETINRINKNFPHWFINSFKNFNNKPEDLPVDQHMLLALIAPRPLYVASATEDLWSDPHGEFLSALAAGAAYRLLGKKGLGTTQPPQPDSSIGNTIRYHIRTGKHDITAFDWTQYINFARETLPSNK